MCMFSTSYIESQFSFSLLCWFNSLNVKNMDGIERIVNQRNQITERKLMIMAQIYYTQVLGKAQSDIELLSAKQTGLVEFLL